MAALDVIFTPHETVYVSRLLAAAMDKAYPGWRDAKGGRAKRGRERLVEAAFFITELNWINGGEVREL